MTIASGSAALASDELNVHNADGTLKNLVVATGNIAAGAVTEAKQTLADNTTGDVSTLAHGYTPKAPNDTNKFLRGDATWAVPPNVVLQIVNTQTGAFATGTTVLPFDDTIPQNTEGDQYMSLAITPSSATNKLKITVTWEGGHSAGGRFGVSLFQDTTANALAAVSHYAIANEDRTITFTHYMVAGTVSEITFKVRAGCASAGTTTFNGYSSARYFGGVMASSITITEIKV